MMLLPDYLIYTKAVTANEVLLKLALTLGQFLILTMIAMISLYISTLHQRLKRLNAENINLLDGMHEGLLILSKTTSSLRAAAKDQILFCNRTAEKLLTRAVSHQSSTGTDLGAGGAGRRRRKRHKTGHEASFESKVVTPRMFHPVKITEKDQQGRKFSEMFENCEAGAAASL